MMNKKGLSVMIGYVLLVSAVIFISIIVYSWMKSYMPVAPIDCPEGVSIFVTNYNCVATANGYDLNLTLKNNGRFNVGGYFINAINATGDIVELTLYDDKGIPLSGQIVQNWMNPGVQYMSTNSNLRAKTPNSMLPDEEILTIFNSTYAPISIEIIPIRWETDKNRLVSCPLAKTSEVINCA